MSDEQKLMTKAIAKFWKHVEITSTCWIWSGAKDLKVSTRSGLTRANFSISPRLMALHIAGVIVPEHIKVNHFSCGNKSCVNPDHLLFGDEERFWLCVNKTQSIADCWTWNAATNAQGYGKFPYRNDTQNEILAHIFSYMLFAKIAKPIGLQVLHHCDYTSCVNPHHLFLGTNQDNVDDKCRKGRQSRGENHNKAILTEEQVKQIRKLKTSGLGATAISKMFPVAINTIREIIRRNTWKHIE